MDPSKLLVLNKYVSLIKGDSNEIEYINDLEQVNFWMTHEKNFLNQKLINIFISCFSSLPISSYVISITASIIKCMITYFFKNQIQECQTGDFIKKLKGTSHFCHPRTKEKMTQL